MAEFGPRGIEGTGGGAEPGRDRDVSGGRAGRWAGGRESTDAWAMSTPTFGVDVGESNGQAAAGEMRDEKGGHWLAWRLAAVRTGGGGLLY